MSDKSINCRRKFVGALDIGTSSVRFYIFGGDTAEVITFHQVEVPLSFPQHGWVEQDPMDILNRSRECIEQACENLKKLGYSVDQIKAVGVTNQRETLVVWSKETGKPLHNAIIWSDNRTGSLVSELKDTLPGGKDDCVRYKTGLSLSTYFTGPKFLWLYRNNEIVRQAVDGRQCLIGTVDSWIVWALTGEHVTDVSNASRTLLMNISTLTYDENLLKLFNVPPEILPTIKSSSEIYGRIKEGALQGVPISGILGDQQAALVGHLAFQPGKCKATYGTGCFLLCNVGTKPIFSDEGLLTTVAYQLGPDARASYAFEGAVAVAGAGINWLRDNLHIASTAAEIEKLASEVNESDCAFVPAFSGLYCPYWEPRAQGIISGLSYSITNRHLARAALEAVCLHVAEITEIIARAGNFSIDPMYVDGGMSTSNLLMQMQCDITGMTVIRPSMLEVSALGAALAAGLANGVNVFTFEKNTISSIPSDTCDTFFPKSTVAFQMKRQRHWKAAIRKCLLDLDDVAQNGNGEKPAGFDISQYYPLEIFCIASISILALSEAFSG